MEGYFFKVFRNKYLFKKIFEYVKDNNYNHIKPILKTIRKLFILINIKNKDIQIHKYYGNDQTNEDTIELLKSFYKLLFDKYKDYFDFNFLSKLAIKSKNLLILKLILENNYLNTNIITNQFINILISTCIESKSLKILNYILSLNNNNKNYFHFLNQHIDFQNTNQY
ncbi:hypothetical protein ACTA71_008528 [Dictyostelium dimigraforme]